MEGGSSRNSLGPTADIRVPVVQVGGIPGQILQHGHPTSITLTSSCLVTGPFLDAVHLAELLEPERVLCIKRKNTIIFIAIVDVIVTEMESSSCMRINVWKPLHDFLVAQPFVKGFFRGSITSQHVFLQYLQLIDSIQFFILFISFPRGGSISEILQFLFPPHTV